MIKKTFRYVLFFLIMLVITASIFGCTQSNKIDKGGTTAETTDRLTTEEAERIHALTLEAADELNENSDIDNSLLKKIDNIDDYSTTNYQWGESDMPAPEVIVVREGSIDGYTASYPYDVNNQCLARLDIYSDKSDVFGIKTGDNISSVRQIMNKFGYTSHEISDNNQAYHDSKGLVVEEYKKHDIIVSFRAKKADSLIEIIHIFVVDCNLPPEDSNAITESCLKWQLI